MKGLLTAYLQSEKIRTGLFWTSRLLQRLEGLPGYQRPGALQVVSTTLQMIGEEARLARKLGTQEKWIAVETNLDLAVVMIDSDASTEALSHIRDAFTQVTEIGKDQFSLMKAKGIF